MFLLSVRKNNAGRNGSWFTCCSFSDNRDALFPVRYVGDLLMMSQVAVASASRVFSFLDKRVANSNVERAMGMTITNVSFQENDEEKCRIYNIDLQIQPGELIIIVGKVV